MNTRGARGLETTWDSESLCHFWVFGTGENKEQKLLVGAKDTSAQQRLWDISRPR